MKIALKKIKRLEKHVGIDNDTIKKALKKLLNPDQIALLTGKYRKVPRWSNETVHKALKYKFTCGRMGYEELSRNLPLPSLRTLSRRLQSLKFTSGILDDMFEFLRIKVRSFTNNLDKHCMLVFDEMGITPSNKFDTSTNTFIGCATLPNNYGETNVACHALVFMLGGIASRWKQVIAFYFTGKTFDGRLLKPIICEIIKKAEDIGLRVHSVTSDMASTNQAMWASFGIKAAKYSTINNACNHPNDENRKLFFFHDCVYAFKNISQSLLNNKIIYIPDKVVTDNDLPTNEINVTNLEDLCGMQETLNFGLSLVPKLKSKLLDNKNHFQKMKVSNATAIISHQVASALKFVGNELDNESYITTAWFISFISKWFKLMTSRTLKLALSKLNERKFNQSINFLNEVIKVIRDIKVGISKIWKPFQTGIIISTKSAIELTKYLLDEEGFEFVLMGRFTQDCLENLFSIVRSKNVIPNALQFKNDLKLISILQYMKDVKSCSYERDDRKFFSEFLDFVLDHNHKKGTENNDVECNDVDIVPDNNNITFDNFTLNCLYYLGGSIIHKIKKNYKICDNCISAIGNNTPTEYSYATLTRMRCFKEEILFFLNEDTFNFILKMENIFRTYYEQVSSKSYNLKLFFINKCKDVYCDIPPCHCLKERITECFFNFRLKKMSTTYVVEKRDTYFSKSIAMHNNIN